MRAFKFRVFGKENSVMYDWETLLELDDFKDHMRFASSEDRYYSPVMQYTGMKDKNGNEIYEGDVIRTSLGHVATVEWDEENGRFLAYTATRSIMYVGREPVVEVIGNIYENPELQVGRPIMRHSEVRI